jgi:hypothetical protein
MLWLQVAVRWFISSSSIALRFCPVVLEIYRVITFLFCHLNFLDVVLAQHPAIILIAIQHVIGGEIEKTPPVFEHLCKGTEVQQVSIPVFIGRKSSIIAVRKVAVQSCPFGKLVTDIIHESVISISYIFTASDFIVGAIKAGIVRCPDLTPILQGVRPLQSWNHIHTAAIDAFGIRRRKRSLVVNG